jgi:hypothetical protein
VRAAPRLPQPAQALWRLVVAEPVVVAMEVALA